MFTQEGEEEFKDLAEEDDDGDDEEERFVDADKLEEGANAETEEAETEEAETKEAKPAASWVHHQNLEGLWADQIYDQYLAFLCVTVTIT